MLWKSPDFSWWAIFFLQGNFKDYTDFVLFIFMGMFMCPRCRFFLLIGRIPWQHPRMFVHGKFIVLDPCSCFHHSQTLWMVHIRFANIYGTNEPGCNIYCATNPAVGPVFIVFLRAYKALQAWQIRWGFVERTRNEGCLTLLTSQQGYQKAIPTTTTSSTTKVTSIVFYKDLQRRREN